MEKAKEIITNFKLDLDLDLLEYALGYFTEKDSDFTTEGIKDFLLPILSTDSSSNDDFHELCLQLSSLYTSASNHQEKKTILLNTTRVMTDLTSVIKLFNILGNIISIHVQKNTLEFTQNRVTDIRHGSTKVVLSQVDQKKLEKAEKKSIEKQKVNSFY
jgi:hypothetical protein